MNKVIMSSQIRKRVNKKITKAIHDFNLIEDGDRVLIATSGGKDSSVLLMELAARLGKFGPKCELAAIHIQSDFADKAPREFLQRMAEEYPQVPFYFKDVAVEARLKEGRKLNCYWCSTQRRTELIKFASENNFNKIALGHHMDDIVETLLMNMLYKGEFSGMPPMVPYEKYPCSIIRPLCYCEESEIIAYAEDADIRKFTCTCEFSKASHRKTIREEIKSLTKGSSTLKANLFESMRNIRMDYLL
ncbi:tRNA 2-thiocytidine biosynthesis TtcA family protein [Fibrobacter sp. UWB7]|uniref:tRNA 2-thiocytidine biosynthesis TtcA family protein n=1 Tax=Fibrobacter sp. UWB7 TaxID=1896206 RepID=UPI001FCD8039|nr:tRNA 2-thiocytidine biosynthesis TtcA family protein [Fibrobacter sp. UWB7]